MASQAQIPNQQRETRTQSVRVVSSADGWQRRSRAGFSWRVPSHAHGLSKRRRGTRVAASHKKNQKKNDTEEIRTLACRDNGRFVRLTFPYIAIAGISESKIDLTPWFDGLTSFNHSATVSALGRAHACAELRQLLGETAPKKKVIFIGSTVKPVFGNLTRGRLTSGQKRKNAARASERNPTTPHSRRGCKPSTSPRRNNPKHLPPKKRPCWAHPPRHTRTLFTAARSEGAP